MGFGFPIMKPIRAITILLSLLPIFVVGSYITIQGQPVPYWDEWIEPLNNALKTADGSITFSDLTRQYNDSRPFFTNLLTVVSVWLTGWNLKTEMYFNMVIAGCTLVLLLSIYRRHHGRNAIFAALPFSLLIFSLAQHRNWLWAIQSQYFFLLLFLTLALWSLDSNTLKWPSLGVAGFLSLVAVYPFANGFVVYSMLLLFLVFAVWILGKPKSKWFSISLGAFFSLCATYSYANGFLVWFSLVPVLWMMGYGKIRYFVFWSLATAVALGHYFAGYQSRVFEEGMMLDPIALLRFTAGFIGNALVAYSGPWDYGYFLGVLAIGASGLILLLLNLILLHRFGWSGERLSVWVGLATFVVASGLLVALARTSSSTAGSSLAARYTTLSSPFWLAFAALSMGAIREGYRNWHSSKSARVLLIANLFSAVFLSAVFLDSSLRCTQLPPRVTPSHRDCLLAVPETRDLSCLKGAHSASRGSMLTSRGRFGRGFRSRVLQQIDQMKYYRLGVFSVK